MRVDGYTFPQLLQVVRNHAHSRLQSLAITVVAVLRAELHIDDVHLVVRATV